MAQADVKLAEQWMSLSDACKLLHMHINKLNRMIAKYQLQVRTSKRDERKRYVDVVAVKRILGEA
jgi:hypothetical protein